MNDPLGSVKLAIRQANAVAARIAASLANGEPVSMGDVQAIQQLLSPLTAAGGTLDLATNALVQCRTALAGRNLGAVPGPNGAAPNGYVASTQAAGMAAGALVVGLLGGYAGTKFLGKSKQKDKPAAAKEAEPKPYLEPGDALQVDAKTGKWREVRVTPRTAESAEFVGHQEVAGEKMAVFRSLSGVKFAQIAGGAEEAPMLSAGEGA